MALLWRRVVDPLDFPMTATISVNYFHLSQSLIVVFSRSCTVCGVNPHVKDIYDLWMVMGFSGCT
jgi:hypothetical protein